MSFEGVVDNRWSIAHGVSVEVIQPIKESIQTSQPYLDFENGRTRCFVGPDGKGQWNRVVEYLVGHGLRAGTYGTLCGVMHVVSQAVKGFFIASDEYYALEEIESLLAQRDKLQQGYYPKTQPDIALAALSFVPPLPEADQVHINAEARGLLNRMLAVYNSR